MHLRRLRPHDAAAYRAFMLGAYASDPDAFTSTVAERERLPLAWWERRVADRPTPASRVLGAFEGDQIVGAAGLRLESRPRTLHKATLFGLSVAPAFRGRGIARRLTSEVLDHARAAGARVVRLTVAEPNTPARTLYESLGFRAFGTEPLALRDGDRYVGLVHMWIEIEPDGD